MNNLVLIHSTANSTAFDGFENSECIKFEDFLYKDSDKERYDSITIISGDALIKHDCLYDLMKALKGSGKLSIKYQNGIIDSCETEMKLCGFLSIEMDDSSISGTKPGEIGVQRRRKVAQIPDLKSLLSSDNNSNIKLVDDSQLLKDEDYLKPPGDTSNEACGPQAKKKACKNCSCGLKEQEESEAAMAAKSVDTANAKSSCGSCYLGDAFRCAGCPYRGLPAFKPGEQVQLPTDILQDDLEI